MKKSIFVVILSFIFMNGFSLVYAKDKSIHTSTEKSLKETIFSEPEFSKMLAAFHQALPGDLRAFQFSIIYDNMYDKGKNKCGLKLVNGQDMPATFGSLSEYIYQDGKVRPDFKRKTEDLQRSNTQIDLFDWKNTAVERIPALVKQSLAKFNLVIEKVNLITVYVGGSHVLDLPNPSKPFEGHGEIENAFIKILIDAADKYHVRNIIMVADSKGNVIKLHKGEFPIRSSK